MGKRIFEVSEEGIVVEIEEPDEAEIKTEEEEFLAEVRNCSWFKDLLEKLGMSEKEWLENCVRIGMKTIRCSKCKKRFIPDRSAKTRILMLICDPCLDKWADNLLRGKKADKASRPKRRGVFYYLFLW